MTVEKLAQTQYDLGFNYAHRDDVEQDYAEAVRWYRKAADRTDSMNSTRETRQTVRPR
jgi:TPR repeat protein